MKHEWTCEWWTAVGHSWQWYGQIGNPTITMLKQRMTVWKDGQCTQAASGLMTLKIGAELAYKSTAAVYMTELSRARTLTSVWCQRALRQGLCVVISLSKIDDHDWSYTHHVICTNNHCWPVQRSTWLGNMISRTSSHAFMADFWSERYIRHISYIFCAV